MARRLVRRLTAHGVKVWIDERELRLGATLTTSLRSQIDNADVLVVIASKASTASKWVGLELDFAREHGKPIIPFFIEPLTQHERFRDDLGVDATSPQAFADAMHGLMRDVFLSLELEVPPANPNLLEAGLRELAKEEPDLAPLIDGFLDSEGLHQENMNTALKAAFHPLDDALNALVDLRPNDSSAYHAAYGFSWAGAGARALSSWIAATGNGEIPLAIAVGAKLEPALIPTAIKLLAACNPPNNSALYDFIHHNAAQFDERQRRSVIRLVTWPVRDTSRFGDVLGWVAFKHFPDASELQQMWSRWVRTGAFDGKPHSPRDLARYLADAHNEGLSGWEPVNEALRRYVRECLRSGDEKKVWVGLDHLQATADSGAAILSSLLRETQGVSGTSEWDDWTKRDPDTAERMKWCVLEFAREAAGDRNWLRAIEGADQALANEKQLQRTLGRDKQEPDVDA